MTVHSRSPARRDASAARRDSSPLIAKHQKPTPLPKAQLAIIYAIKLTLPISSTQTMPYYNILIEKLAASEGAETGYYSGLAVCP